LNCKRLVGRKAWRQVIRQLEKKVLGWDTYINFDDPDHIRGQNVYRVFVVENPEQAQPCAPMPCPQPKRSRETIRISVPNGGEPMEIQVSPAVAERLRGKVGEALAEEFSMAALEKWADEVEAEEAAEAEVGHPWPQPGHKLHDSDGCGHCADAEVAEPAVPNSGFSYGKLTAIVSEGLNQRKPHVKRVRRAKQVITLQKGLLSYSIPAEKLTAHAAAQLREAVKTMPLVSTAQTGPDIEHMIDLALAQSKQERAAAKKERAEALRESQ
jgi:hypothetical protein